MLPILGSLHSGVSWARASEAQFIGVKRKPLPNEGQDPFEEPKTYWEYLFYNGDEYYRVIVFPKNFG